MTISRRRSVWIWKVNEKCMWKLEKLFLYSSSPFFNDHAFDNGVRHALTLLAMTAMLMMCYRSLSSQFLEASLFLSDIRIFLCLHNLHNDDDDDVICIVYCLYVYIYMWIYYNTMVIYSFEERRKDFAW